MKARLYIVLCIAFITQMAGVLPLQAGHYYYKQISLKEWTTFHRPVHPYG